VAILADSNDPKQYLQKMKHNNNYAERHNREISRMFDALSAFQSHFGAQSTSTIYKMIHNYINPYSMLDGKTPAEVAELICPWGE
jgi:transposase-like protein